MIDQVDADVSSLTARTIVLRPLVAGDYPILQHIATSGHAALSWRLRGRSVSPEAFPAMLWNDCLAQFVIAPKNEPWSELGLVSAFNYDALGQTAYLSVLLSGEAAGRSPALAEALLVFVPYLHEAFSLRKVYAESCSYSMAGIDNVATRFACVHEEGRLRDHWRFGDRWYDLVLLSVWVDEFLVERDTWMPYVAGHTHTLVDASTLDIQQVLREQLALGNDVDLSGGTSLHDELGLDSLDLFELLCALEERFGLEFGEHLPQLNCLQDIYALVHAA